MQSIAAVGSRFDEKLLELSSLIDVFEGYGHAHGLRIATIADALGQVFNISAHDRSFMQQAAFVHDIGEMVMDRPYIKAVHTLTDDERMDLHRHPVIGEQEAAKRGLPRSVQLLVRWHHEWWNGSGYPDCLEGDQIPMAARILRLADTYSALTSDRPHHTAVSDAEARRYLSEWAGIEFDPKVVKAFLSIENPETLHNEEPEPAAEPADNRDGKILNL